MYLFITNHAVDQTNTCKLNSSSVLRKSQPRDVIYLIAKATY